MCSSLPVTSDSYQDRLRDFSDSNQALKLCLLLAREFTFYPATKSVHTVELDSNVFVPVCDKGRLDSENGLLCVVCSSLCILDLCYRMFVISTPNKAKVVKCWPIVL
jgi:hypothetical protein